jgi:K+-sensing histidine kinase KdpD
MEKEPLNIPAEMLEAAHISPEEARLALALGLFHGGKLSRDRASDFSGDPTRFEASLFPSGEQLDLNDFLDWGSHDLKTPLNMVIGFSKVVLKGIDGPINETQETDLTSVHNNGQRLLTLISMLVDIARLNKGSLHLSLVEEDFALLLEETAAHWKAQNPSRDMAADLHVDAPSLQLDWTRMKQALSGALTYAGLRVVEGGTVTLSANEDAERVNVSIESRGAPDPAMPELDTVMLRFIDRSLVRLHGGNMDEAENPEGGVTVRFWLPKQ